MATPGGSSPHNVVEIRRPGNVERVLRLFSDVRAGEAPTALLLMINVFLLFTAYYLIKPIREDLILQGGSTEIFGWTVGKAQIKSYSSALMAALLVFVVKSYAGIASRVPRHKLIAFVTLFFVSNLLVFFVLTQRPAGVWLGIAFFVWVGIFNNLVVAQFWAFANDVYLPEQGKRLFPIVGFGASSGAVGGSWIAGKLFVLGEPQMLLVAAGLLCLCIGVTLLVHRRQSGELAERATRRAVEAEQPVGRGGGFQLIFADRYLLFIALLILVANVVNTTGEFILGKKVSDVAAGIVASGAAGQLNEGQWIGQFYSNYFFWVNLLTAVLQLFVVSRILKYAGVRAALFLLPLVAFCGYTVLVFGAALGVIRIVKIFENSTDYSVQNTTRQALFLPTSREVKYKAKAAIDTFFVRIGDFASAILVFVGTAVALSIEQFAVVNLLLVGVWILLAVGVARRHRKLTADGEGEPASRAAAS
jgi:AAA family ATP:ADP antiporter